MNINYYLAAVTLTAYCAPPQPARVVRLTRTVRLPVEVVSVARAPGNPIALGVTPGATDELPEGPRSFDVLPDGGFVVSDPLRKRLASYDAQGNYRGEEPLPFAPSEVNLPEGGPVQVRRSTTDETFELSARGEPQPLPAARAAESARGEAELRNRNLGVIRRPLARGGGPAELPVRYEGEGRMISLREIGWDRDGGTYVALETTRGGGERIEVATLIRRYAADGTLVCRIEDVPANDFLRPTTEFRVRDGVVYQLVPHETEVLINVWETN